MVQIHLPAQLDLPDGSMVVMHINVGTEEKFDGERDNVHGFREPHGKWGRCRRRDYRVSVGMELEDG